MSPEKFALAVAVAVFAAGVIGLLLQRILPESSTTGGPRDMISAVVGLLTLLAALTMGLLIWTAYGVYAGQNAAIQALAAKALQLYLALADYGPEAKNLRPQLRDGLGKTIDAVWGANENDANFVANNFAEALHNLRAREQALDAFRPSTDAQTQALAVAKATSEAIGQWRLQLSFALAAPVSYPLILTVVAWALLLFCGFGLMSRGHAMSMVVLYRCLCGCERRLHDPRSQQSLFRRLPRVPRAAPTGVGGDGQGVKTTLPRVDLTNDEHAAVTALIRRAIVTPALFRHRPQIIRPAPCSLPVKAGRVATWC
jgi:hypothetical protein